METQSSCYAVEFDDPQTDTSDLESDFVIAPVRCKWTYFLDKAWRTFDEGMSRKLESSWAKRPCECEVQIDHETWVVYMPSRTFFKVDPARDPAPKCNELLQRWSHRFPIVSFGG